MDNPFKSLSKPQLYAAIAGAAGIGGYMIYDHHKKTGSWNPWSSATAATTSAGTAASIDPITGLAYSQDNATDPVTGQQYLAEAEQYGSVAAAEAAVSAFGQSTATGSGIGVNPASPASSGSINTPVGTSVYTSNAAWAQAATAGLADVGYSETDVATALGDYLTQTPLTPAQAQLVNVAIAEYGPAPVGNLQVILQPASQPSTTTTGSGPTVPPTPVPAGSFPSRPVPPATPGGVHQLSVTGNSVSLAWDPVPGATSYRVRATYQGALAGQIEPASPGGTVHGLTPDHTYTFHVAAVNSAGTSPETNGPAIKTSK